MHKIVITASTGEKYPGLLPASWKDVTLGHYAALAFAENVPDHCRAVAALTGLPAQVLLDDTSLLLPLRETTPWLFGGNLPEAADEEPPTLKHRGITYRHVGNLQRINAGQFEALHSFIQQHAGKPLAAAPSLLAVLYCPDGQEQTGEVVQQAAEAFATLPMATAWPPAPASTRKAPSTTTCPYPNLEKRHLPAGAFQDLGQPL